MNFLRTAFLDLLFNTLLVFVVLFALAFTQMRPPKQDEAVEPKAELMLEMTWPDGSFDDVDLWLLMPDGRKVGFRQQDTGVGVLDRDDLGAFNDRFHDGTQMQLIRLNRELMTVRAVMPGRYVVNVHYYRDHDAAMIGEQETHTGPIPVKVKLSDVNPRLRVEGENEVTLFSVGQQVTVFAFDVDANGAVSGVDKTTDLPFVEMR